ncbi:unnamed protein product [Clavelina lepadiformis]|uniref:Uncharacterized protein n=1 Tax=Clavelina lepadiformis TaxID=159417 RepID=A0ABP0G3K0_CLALP
MVHKTLINILRPVRTFCNVNCTFGTKWFTSEVLLTITDKPFIDSNKHFETHSNKHFETHSNKHFETHSNKHFETHSNKHFETHSNKHFETNPLELFAIL